MKHFILLPLCLALGVASCSKREATQSGNSNSKTEPPIDACSLLTGAEIETVQGQGVQGTTPSDNAQGAFIVSQCYFTVATPVNSVVITLTQQKSESGARGVKDFWRETFHPDQESEKEREKEGEREREGEKEKPKPEKIDGVGDDAFWVGSRFGGALYVLKGNRTIRISVGGADDQPTKIKKSKALAQMALKRL